jgi:hypothetical protein
MLAYGLERLRVEDGSSASSQYTLELAHDRCLRLWWVLATYGLEYRRACLRGWSKRPLASEVVPAAWEELAKTLEVQPVRGRLAKAG